MTIGRYITELEQNADIFAQFIYRTYDIRKDIGLEEKDDWDLILNFSESETGRKIAGQFTEKIKSCNDRKESYEELNLQNKFNKYKRQKTKEEIKQWDKV